MVKKYSAVFLVIVMLLQTVMVGAAPQNYTPGDKTMQIAFENPIALNNAIVDSGVLKISAGGSASFDAFLNADMVTATVTYSTSSTVNFSIKSEVESYVKILAANETTATMDIAIRRGSHILEFSADNPVTISDITLTKASEITGTGNTILTALTEFEEALQTTVVIKSGAVALRSNNAMRYIDYEDSTATPVNIDGKMYLPTHTAARVFSMYYEDYTDLGYVFLSDDNIEIYNGDKGCYYIKNGIRKELSEFAIYLDGKSYVPVRQLAELLDLVVEYKDGYVVIDDRLRVKKIMENDAIFNELKSEFEQFEVSNAKTGSTYHVSKAPYASDNNTLGTADFPFATIQKAASVAKAGDTVIIHEGVYRETVTPANDGTATSPIVFKAAEGEDVTISAFEEISGFIPFDEAKGIYQTDIPQSMGFDRNFIIMVDEETSEENILREGRHPNSDTTTADLTLHPDAAIWDNPMRATMGDIRMPTKDTYAVSNVDLNQKDDFWKGGTYVTLTGWGWGLAYAKIVSSTKGKILVQDYKKPDYGITYFAIGNRRPREYGFITNHMNTVDMPGEWFISDKNILYMIPPDGIEGEDLKVEIKQRQRVIDMTDRKFVKFENINTRGGGVTMAGDSEMCVMNGGTHKYISHFGYSVGEVTHTTRLYNPDTRNQPVPDAPEFGEAGFFANGKNNAYINMDIEYSAGAGIYLVGKYSYIENNRVAYTSYAGAYPSGITVESIRGEDPTKLYGGHTVVSNTVYSTGRSCFYMTRGPIENAEYYTVYPMVASEISYNYLHHGNVTAHDTGNVYTYGITAGNDWSKTEVHHNIIHDNVTDPTDSQLHMGIYFDGNSSMIKCHSNIVFNKYERWFPQKLHAFYYQHGDATSQIDDWGNVNLGIFPEGMDGITTEDYPYAKPFKTGVTRDGEERFMLNYNQYSEANTIFAQNAVLGEGAFLDSEGFVKLPTPESYAELGEYDFSNTGSKVSVYFASDKYKSTIDNISKYTLEIKQGGKVVHTVERDNFNSDGALDSISTVSALVPGTINGKATVSLKVSNGNMRLAKIRVDACDFEKENTELEVSSTADLIYMGDFDSYTMGTSIKPVKVTFKMGRLAAEYNSSYYISQTDDHSFVYNDRTLHHDVNTLSMRIGCAQYWANTKIEIRLNDPNSEPVAVVDLMEYYRDSTLPRVWQTQTREITLNNPIPAGTYDFYVDFVGYKPDGIEVEGNYGITDCYFMAWD